MALDNKVTFMIGGKKTTDVKKFREEIKKTLKKIGVHSLGKGKEFKFSEEY